MKKLITYIVDFVRRDFSLATYLLVALFLSIGIFLNYHFHIEREIIHAQSNPLVQFFLYLLLYCLAYYGVFFIYVFTKKKNFFSDKGILFKPFLALLLVAFDRAFELNPDLLFQVFQINFTEAQYLAKVFNIVVPSFFYLFGIYLIYKNFEKKADSIYGLSLRKFDIVPYFYMLLCMLPLLVSASFRPDFTAQYPFFKYWNFSEAFGWSPRQLFSFYEFFYLANFVNIELSFRGLLVIGMMRLIGTEALLPMVVTYAFLHFGKPYPETISSIFGGYILGVFAFKTENIMGGIFIHMAIALLMDLLAIAQ